MTSELRLYVLLQLENESALETSINLTSGGEPTLADFAVRFELQLIGESLFVS
jgi:hypothetical protein